MSDTTRTPPDATSSPFQFRLRDMGLVVLIISVAVAAFAQRSLWLGVSFVVVLFVCIGLVWRRQRLAELLAATLAIGFVLYCLWPTQTSRTPSKRTICSNNLRQIYCALQAYHVAHGDFPPAHIADSQGRPIHSWRALLLPYLEPDLAPRYRFDEPWDGPNNRLLAAEVVDVFCCPTDAGRELQTSYVAIVGPGTAWPGEKRAKLSDLIDGPSNVILLAEVHDSGIHWMEPRDLHILQMAPAIDPPSGQGISSQHGPNKMRHGANVLFADGHVNYLEPDTPADDLRQLIGIGDGTPK